MLNKRLSESFYFHFCNINTLRQHQDVQHHYFFTQMVLPMSTFALAIGYWDMVSIIDKSMCNVPSNSSLQCPDQPISQHSRYEYNTDINCADIHEPYPCHVRRGDSGPYLPCRIFGPHDLISEIRNSESWNLYVPACLESSYELLGSHPFSKVDLLFLPKCFSGLGLASPSLVFLSQSLFVNKGKVCTSI